MLRWTATLTVFEKVNTQTTVNVTSNWIVTTLNTCMGRERLEMTMKSSIQSNHNIYDGMQISEMLTFLINAFRTVSSSNDDTNIWHSSGGNTAIKEEIYYYRNSIHVIRWLFWFCRNFKLMLDQMDNWLN